MTKDAHARPSLPNGSAVVAVLVALATAAPRETAAAERLVIQSNSDCPSAEVVHKALLELRAAEDWPSTTVSIQVKEQRIFVDLGAGSASRRTIPAAPDCDARAATVALVVATWANDLPAQTVTSPVLQPTTNVSAGRSPLEPAPANARHGHHEIGGGLLAAMGGGIAPGIRVELVSLRGDSGVGWLASLVVPGARDLTVGSGKTAWTRASAGLALHGRLARNGWFLSGDAGMAVATTVVWGHSYSSNQTDQSLTYGPSLGVRGGLPWKPLEIWLDLRGGRWLYDQSVQIDDDAGQGVATASLPAWDVQCALGASYAF
jgi:hypothetical protein